MSTPQTPINQRLFELIDEQNPGRFKIGDLSYGTPVVDNRFGCNTRIPVTIRGSRFHGTEDVWYKRLDLSELMIRLGTPTPKMDEAVVLTYQDVIAALNDTYDLGIDPNEIIPASIVSRNLHLVPKADSKRFIGDLLVRVEPVIPPMKFSPLSYWIAKSGPYADNSGWRVYDPLDATPNLLAGLTNTVIEPDVIWNITRAYVFNPERPATGKYEYKQSAGTAVDVPLSESGWINFNPTCTLLATILSAFWYGDDARLEIRFVDDTYQDVIRLNAYKSGTWGNQIDVYVNGVIDRNLNEATIWHPVWVLTFDEDKMNVTPVGPNGSPTPWSLNADITRIRYLKIKGSARSNYTSGTDGGYAYGMVFSIEPDAMFVQKPTMVPPVLDSLAYADAPTVLSPPTLNTLLFSGAIAPLQAPTLDSIAYT